VRQRARERAARPQSVATVRETDEPPRYDPGEPDDLLAEVVAWQPVVLAAPRRCARTGRELRPGERAYVGLGEHGPLGVYLAESALDRPA
jgi:hypothetical protein